MIRIAVAAVVLAVLGASIYWAGGRSDRLKDEINNRDTLERIEHGSNDSALDDTGVLDWLRDLAK